jgi:NADP-dependent 3-hydroxy acid dehydrogenase YdfG
VTDAASCSEALTKFVGPEGALDALFNSAGLLAIGRFDALELKRQNNQVSDERSCFQIFYLSSSNKLHISF